MSTESISEKELVENLLKVRYKIIADWPENEYGVGTILPPPNDIIYEHEAKFFDKYPHLFRKLEWWEERKEEEMPKYVKNVNFSLAPKGSIVIAKSWQYYSKNGMWFMPEGEERFFNRFAGDYEPCTQQDYLSFINQNKQS